MLFSANPKVDRFIIFWKAFVRQLKLLRYPHAVISVRIDNGVINDDVLAMGILYVCAYLGLVFIATISYLLANGYYQTQCS